MNCFCTIITSGYISHALALRESLLHFGQDFHFFILISDKNEVLKESVEKKYDKTTVIFPGEICSTGMGKAIYEKYFNSDITKFRWCMKPVFIKYLLQERQFEKVVYTDADIYFYNDYNFLMKYLDEFSVLLTPHWRSSDPHKEPVNFEVLYTSGIYNGGFVGASKNGTKAMEWWAMACEFICTIDPARGMFGDQVHLNLLPVYFDKVLVLKHKGCNVANWNILECARSTDKDDKVLIAHKYPLIFVHFTNSTIKGIVSGDDALLLPYLKKYYETLNMQASALELPGFTNPGSEDEKPLQQKLPGTSRMRRIIKRIVN